MKTRLFLVTVFSVAFSFAALAQTEKPSSNIGLSLEGGYSHLFLGNPLSAIKPDATPGSGVGGGAALFYELQYKHFLFRTGFGMDYSLNTNKLRLTADVPILEYPTMTYHYEFDRFKEQTTYGTAYVPVYFGGIWNKFFFLAGAKIGVLPFGGMTTPSAKVNVWATDEDVLDPMYNLYTHDMTQYSFRGEKMKIGYQPINAMLSLELGINLDKRAWADEKEVKKMDREARYRELHRRRTFKEQLHYRLSFFADYGLMNIREPYSANPVPFASDASTGGLVAFNSASDLTPHSMLGYAPLQDSKLNNFLLGVKFAIMYEIPKKAPKKGAMANPFLYAYVTDQLTAKPLANTRVLIQNTDQPKQKLDRATDAKFGRVGKAMPAGKYKVNVSHPGYFPDSMVYTHQDKFDTIYVALYPEQTLNVVTTDAKSGRPVGATITLYDERGNVITTANVDSAANMLSAVLDGRKRYYVCAESRGYIGACDSVLNVTELKNLKLEPKLLRKFILQNMFFATDKTKILPTSEDALQLLYNLLVENPDMRIKIIGHTDDVASDQYNQKLSEGRARSVRKEMIDRGIDGKRIETEGHGEKDPIVPNDSDEHRQMNRRVEIEILSGIADDHVISNEQLKR